MSDTSIKLSLVLVCANHRDQLQKALPSILAGLQGISSEVIVCDNASTDGTASWLRREYPQVRVIESPEELTFSRINNLGIRPSRGEYVMLLNPPMQIPEGMLAKWLAYADAHPKAGAMGCRIEDETGGYRPSARPFPTPFRDWLMALYLRPLGRLSDWFISDEYLRWHGDSERTVDWLSGCILFRGDLLRNLGGFDELFPYQYDDIDLCKRVWDAGYSVLYTPEVKVTRLGPILPRQFPVLLAIAKARSRYRYFYKHHGRWGARQVRLIQIWALRLRSLGFILKGKARHIDRLDQRLQMYKASLEWNRRTDPVKFVELGEEPDLKELVESQ